MSDGVRRMHVPIVLKDVGSSISDTDGTWFVACHACSHEAGHHVVECSHLMPGQAWPPYNLREDIRPPKLTPGYVDTLKRQFDEDATPADLIRSITGVIEHHISNRPRSLQKAIGPSEIGGECGRKIAYKLAGAPIVNPASQVPSWRTQVGVAVHDMLAGVMDGYDRFTTEQRVTVGSDGDDDVSGSGDLYDAITATVLDWKIVGPATLKRVKAKVQTCYRASCQTQNQDCEQCAMKVHKYHCEHCGKPRGASEKYEVQGDAYGIGYASVGLPVRWIVIAFLPAAGDLQDAYFHVKRFDPANAERAIARLAGTKTLINTLPLEVVAGLTPTADEFCARCEWFDVNASSLGVGCPGHSGRPVRQDSLLKLVPVADSDDLL